MSQLQRRLASLVPGARQVIASHSGHYIQRSQPNLVIDATRAVVHAVRRGDARVAAANLPQTGSHQFTIATVAATLLITGLAVRATARRRPQVPRTNPP
jgi:LPXTG-motif cell wall-anchored protein